MKTIQETSDCQLLADLSEQVQDLHNRMYPHIFKPHSRLEILAHFETEMKTKEVKAFVAVQDGVAKGYVLVYINDEKENPFMYARRYIQLDQLLVIDTYRKQGIGKLLLDRVEQLAAELSINSIKLNHWTANQEARAFFNSNGFVYCHERMTKDFEWIKV